MTDRDYNSRDIARDVSSIARRSKINREPLSAPTTPDPIPETRNVEPRSAVETSGATGSGGHNDLTEDIDQRTYHPEQEILSPDGYYTLVVTPAKTVTMTDDIDGTEIVFTYDVDAT